MSCELIEVILEMMFEGMPTKRELEWFKKNEMVKRVLDLREMEIRAEMTEEVASVDVLAS